MTYEIRSPATGEVIGTYSNERVEDLMADMPRVREAQQVWGALSFHERAAHIRKIQKFLAAHVEETVDVICASTGKTRQDALVTEVLPCIVACGWYADNAQHVLKNKKLSMGSILFFNKSNTLTYQPVGVVGIISPWNYPFSIPFGEIIMSLMAGNGTLYKVASNMTNVGDWMEQCLAAGELPDHLVRHCRLPGATCGPCFLSAGINKLFFTGSVRVGKELMAEASRTLTPVSLELGGNDAMVVLKDADIERAVNCACWAGFQNAGQSCGGVERVYVHESIYPTFLQQLIAKTKALRHGVSVKNPTEAQHVDMGSMTTKGQFDAVKAQLEEAVAKGAVVVAESCAVGDCSKGLFIPATVLTGCTMGMAIMKEETFGPLLPVLPFSTEEEAVRLANDCNLALTSSVFSSSSANARRVARQLDGGVVSINDHLYSHGMAEAPWGGWKDSGLGRTHGSLGLKEMSNVKCINDDCFPTSRNLWWYPFSSSTYSTMIAAASFACPLKCGDRLKSLWHLIRHASFMQRKWITEKGADNKKEA